MNTANGPHPADAGSKCGSGNFLTETYISLRRLENEILNELQGGQIVLGEAINPIQVSISQFYGIFEMGEIIHEL